VREKWEWNWKTGMLIVIPCTVASLVADLIYRKTIVSIIVNGVVAAVSSSFAVFLLWCWQRKKGK